MTRAELEALTDATSAVEIAGKLSAAQRDALLNGKCSVPSSHPEHCSDCLCSADGRVLREMAITDRPALVIYQTRWPNGCVLTSLGLAVRAILQREK